MYAQGLWVLTGFTAPLKVPQPQAGLSAVGWRHAASAMFFFFALRVPMAPEEVQE